MKNVPYEALTHEGKGCFFRHSVRDGFGDLNLTERLVMQIYPWTSHNGVTDDVVHTAFAILRSHLWRVHLGIREAFIVTTQEEFDRGHDEIRTRTRREPVPFDSFIAEAQHLDFEGEWHGTLVNIVDGYRKVGQPIPNPYAHVPADGYDAAGSGAIIKFAFTPKPIEVEVGVSYGCDGHEAAQVYEFIQGEAYVQPFPKQSPTGLIPTGRGAAKASELKKQRVVMLSPRREGGGGADVFISHSSEDKAFVTPLAHAIQAAGISVWYDQFRLKWGMNLVASISDGLAQCKRGVVVLSPNFFAKHKQWTNMELSALVNRYGANDELLILPIFHNMTPDQVRRESPILAPLIGIPSTMPLDEIVQRLRGSLEQ